MSRRSLVFLGIATVLLGLAAAWFLWPAGDATYEKIQLGMTR